MLVRHRRIQRRHEFNSESTMPIGIKQEIFDALLQCGLEDTVLPTRAIVVIPVVEVKFRPSSFVADDVIFNLLRSRVPQKFRP